MFKSCMLLQVLTPEVSDNVKVLAPGFMTPALPSMDSRDKDSKTAAGVRKRKKSITEEVGSTYTNRAADMLAV